MYHYLTPSSLLEAAVPQQVVTTSDAAEKHLRAFEQGCEEWLSYHSQPVDESDLQGYEAFVLSLLKDSEPRSPFISRVRKMFMP